MTEYFYKLLSILLLAILVAVSAGWWMAAHDLRQTHVELVAEQVISEGLRASIREQNRATEALGKETDLALARGLAAQRVATANGRRFDSALARIAGAKATTCDEAMPAVNLLLESVR